jgi:hypothetical protein
MDALLFIARARAEGSAEIADARRRVQGRAVTTLGTGGICAHKILSIVLFSIAMHAARHHLRDGV